jgi:hypothetical protein
VLSGSLARAAGETVAGSPYAITQGTLAANSNYTIHFTGSTLSVRPASTAIVLVPHPVANGKKKLEGIELTAEIKPRAPGGRVPTVQVAFEVVKKHGKKTQVKTLGTLAVKGGAATLSFNPNAMLNQTLNIIYSGNPDFLANSTTPAKPTEKSRKCDIGLAKVAAPR